MKITTLTAVIIGCSCISPIAIAELKTDRAVINADETISASANFSVAESGDLYVATKINGQLIFFANGGKDFTPKIIPFIRNGNYSGKVPLFNLSAQGVPAGRYPLYQVVTKPNSDPLDTKNWTGKLNSINFMINLPISESGDLDEDGFAENDANHDGFYDDDKNQDGFYDDDRDKDGYRDGDLNRDGELNDDEEAEDNTTPKTPEDKEDTEPKEADDKDDDTPSSTDPSILQGQGFYNTCADSACHGADPKANQNRILLGKDPAVILKAIAANTGGMEILKNTIQADSAEKVSVYLKSL